MSLSSEDILELFARHQQRLYLYILAMLPNHADADDVLQNTTIVVWQKFDQFEPGTDFRAWVFRICYYEICKQRERNRHREIGFSAELVDELSAEYHRREELLDTRQAAAPGCIERLAPTDRELLDAVYGRRIDVPVLARQLGRKATSIYRSLRRIRKWLHDCIERAVHDEAKP
jgi:RNA polymerase sigma-70 factor, ECF subfamily